jgi:hypothetical protein
MKPELTTKLKEQFFAQYWGQNVATFKADNHSNHDLEVGTQHPVNKVFSLRLRPLSSISDEDAIEICRMMNHGAYSHGRESKIRDGKDLIKSYQNKQSNVHGVEWLRIYDYLRSKRYALPFHGYSVEELVEAGWIKLID